MIAPKKPETEEARIAALRALRILDTPAEERFDRITRLARRFFDVPIAAVSLVDQEREWFKSRQGIDACESPRSISFCGHAILSPEPLVVPDALEDARFADNPQVAGPARIRFYAGVPLASADGERIGAFCVKDVRPRRLSTDELRHLKDLAAMVERELNALALNAALAQLRVSEERFRNLLDSAPEAIYGIDPKGNCTFANPACVKLLGYKDASELLGRHMNRLIRHSRADGTPLPEEECRIYQAFQESKGAHADDEVFWRADDGCFPVEYWSYPTTQDGKITGAVVTFVDVAERKRLEARLRQSEKLSAVGQLAAGVAHEINNPLGVILGFAQAMARRSRTGDPLELPITSIAREAIRCKNLVQDLLTFARTSQSDREPIDLNQAVQEASSLIRTQARVAQVEFRGELNEELPPILGNKNQLQQIVINLAKNALDAMPSGGILTVGTKLLEAGPLSWVCLKVSDTGTGIPPEILPRIFEPFFTSKPVGQGTGLGLSLVNEIVRKHSGEVEVESRPGSTVFTVKFPARTGRELEERQLALEQERLDDAAVAARRG